MLAPIRLVNSPQGGTIYVMTVEELRAMGLTEHRDPQGRPILKCGEIIVSRGFTLGQFAAHKTVIDSLRRAETEEDWLNVCILFLREMRDKQHPLANETCKEIRFYLNALFHHKADDLWKRAQRIVAKRK